MNLRAIGIYQDRVEGYEKRPVMKLEFAQLSKKSMFESNPNDLAALEEKTFPHLQEELVPGRIHTFPCGDEYHHFMKAPKGNVIMAICSRKDKCDLNELQTSLSYLFRNIYLVKTSRKIKISLEDILKNPQGYIGKGSDVLLSGIEKELSDVKDVMLRNIELVMERGEKIEELEKKSEALLLSSKIFDKRAHDLNRCKC